MIPFERHHNFIIVKVLFQGFIPLRFIVDTGAEHTILIKKEIAQILQISYERELKIMGTDLITEIKAYIARRIRLELTNLTLEKDILVLDDDYFKFDKFVGLDVQGIIGAEVFKGHILKVDYSRQLLTIYTPSVFDERETRKFEKIPIEIIKSKPYAHFDAKISSDSTIQLKLLLDTGASLALLLHTYSTPGLTLPLNTIKGNIASGLGGQIDGYLGRVRAFKMGKSNVVGIISHFQELQKTTDSVYLSGRNGLVGGDLLSRFNFIIDFIDEKLYLQPNRYFKETFEYDKSGLMLIAGGQNLNRFFVNSILPKSPAEEAGILPNDEIIRVNFLSSKFHSLASINRIFQKKEGKIMRLVIKRGSRKQVIYLKLRNLI
ncbi:MAG: hypothetical protein HC817_00275 [Saprospiraceae bacterium]|nr:hypothetical protein [Saprospiraceae bacterium]